MSRCRIPQPTQPPREPSSRPRTPPRRSTRSSPGDNAPSPTKTAPIGGNLDGGGTEHVRSALVKDARRSIATSNLPRKTSRQPKR
jgi:hypothetical protein